MTGITTSTLHMSALFDPADLAAAIEQGYVRRQEHPAHPLSILNYTERCQYERAWNDVTRQCRGLIIGPAGNVVARPFGKFFNYGEHDEATLSLDEFVTITDKKDGSLGIIYREPGGRLAVATRGSFTSDQALHATAILRDRYEAAFDPWAADDEFTHLVEIIYPSNRIVVDYGTTDDLFYLGNVHIASGRTQGPAPGNGWPGPQATVFEGRTLGHALSMEPRPNAEGIVVCYASTGLRLKIKQEDYVALHRLVTGLNARVVWERIGNGEDAAAICGGLPDEFHGWVQEVAGELAADATAILGRANDEHRRLSRSLPAGWTRKDYALEAVKSDLRAWLFMLLDGKDPAPAIWQTLRPSGARSLVAHGEDVA